jgi:hypothetical protein
MSYKFKRILSSLKTGRSYAAGSIVPSVIISEPAVLAELLASGDIELVRPVPISEPIEEPIEEPPVEGLVTPKTRKKKVTA